MPDIMDRPTHFIFRNWKLYPVEVTVFSPAVEGDNRKIYEVQIYDPETRKTLGGAHSRKSVEDGLCVACAEVFKTINENPVNPDYTINPGVNADYAVFDHWDTGTALDGLVLVNDAGPSVRGPRFTAKFVLAGYVVAKANGFSVEHAVEDARKKVERIGR